MPSTQNTKDEKEKLSYLSYIHTHVHAHYYTSYAIYTIKREREIDRVKGEKCTESGMNLLIIDGRKVG